MKHTIILSLGLLLFLGCKGEAQTKQLEITANFQKKLEETVSDEKFKCSGVSMAVIAPDLNLNWTGAAGFDSTKEDQKLTPEQPFRIASITKTYVAAAILRLQEKGKLSISDPISKYISTQHIEILKSDGYFPESITIKHCLQHRSGLFDYAMGSEAYVETALKDSKKRWTRTEQIQFAVDHGEPLGAPGMVFGYSDTGYILLGETIEKLTGQGLAESLKTLLKFKKIGLKDTWLESLEERPANLPQSVHRYMEDMDMSYWDNSIDLYGGGGLSSTSKDLATFIDALFNNRIYENDTSLSLMVTKPAVSQNGKDQGHYRMGLWQINLFDTHGYMHNGFWGTAWVHIPSMNSTIIVNYTNDTNGARLLQKTAKLLKEAIDAK